MFSNIWMRSFLVCFVSVCVEWKSFYLVFKLDVNQQPPQGKLQPLNKYSLNFSFRSHVIPQEKRDSFPRFYFLGDDDLLEILGQATKEEIIQKHIRKLFPGCHSLVIENTTSVNGIKAIRSTEGDLVHLTRTVEMSGAIEVSLVFIFKILNIWLRFYVRRLKF